MKIYIKLPPDEEREKLIQACVQGMIDGSYERFFDVLGDLSERGFSANGIMCLFLQDNTIDKMRENFEDQSSTVLTTEAVFGGPICLN